ncbi:hypothetical protein B0H15DRAFT_184906 [Mycena belliarum]|uniref:Uncharacterized protein n=1 Tax=Mycena belliarum TaxID=1033014 RepID=A0AAD6UB96_9AGAR|nr:hypothetical protein B0H15DRAFT_184906 [Mycena belliae]
MVVALVARPALYLRRVLPLPGFGVDSARPGRMVCTRGNQLLRRKPRAGYGLESRRTGSAGTRRTGPVSRPYRQRYRAPYRRPTGAMVQRLWAVLPVYMCKSRRPLGSQQRQRQPLRLKQRGYSPAGQSHAHRTSATATIPRQIASMAPQGWSEGLLRVDSRWQPRHLRVSPRQGARSCLRIASRDSWSTYDVPPSKKPP